VLSKIDSTNYNTQWVAPSGGGGSPNFAQDAAPASAANNTLWFATTTGTMYWRYYDGDSTQWVAAAPPSNAMANAVKYDAPQGLSRAQQYQARDNIAIAKKNYVINGAMMISQENGTTSGTTNGYYPVDQFFLGISGTSGAAAITQGVLATPGGSPNRIRVQATTADSAVAAGDIVWVQQRIEGLRCADLLFGTASAKTITVQFGVRAPAGTYSFTIANNGGSRSYVSEYVIAAGEANTDVVKAVTIPGDITGTWNKDNTIGFDLRWGLMVGSSSQQAAGSWGTANALGSPNQFNFMGTVNNVFDLFDVGLYEGSVVPPFTVPDYASELQSCLRYWEKGDRALGFAGSITSGGSYIANSAFAVPKRSTPTMTFTDIGSSNFNALPFFNNFPYSNRISVERAASATGYGYFYSNFIANARL
jgi:hypothetical protein